MTKEIYSLPSDFGLNNETSIYFYSNDKSSVKNKIIYTTNVLCLLLCGKKEVQTPTGKEIITSKDMMILTSGSVLLSESVSDSNKSEAIIIFFDNKILLDVCAKHKVTIAPGMRPNQLLKISRDDFIDNFCQSLQLLRQQNNTAINELKVQEILSYLSSKFPVIFNQLVAQAVDDAGSIKLQQIVDLNAAKNLTIEELAFLCNRSVSTFKRHFVEIYGLSPRKYFTQLKMEQAKLLLSLQKRPSAIYLELGYENLSAFSNEFKKYHGVSPNSFKLK
jgi:AraC family transcriptional regulator, exoenzyme S synthesis regulatory protein ExsA